MLTETAAVSTRALEPRLAPGPKGKFIVGCLPEVRRDILSFLHALPLEYGEVVRFKLGPETVHLIFRRWLVQLGHDSYA